MNLKDEKNFFNEKGKKTMKRHDTEFFLNEWKATPKTKIRPNVKRWLECEAGIVDFCIAYWGCVLVALCALLAVWVKR
jgi:hypothetical protein